MVSKHRKPVCPLCLGRLLFEAALSTKVLTWLYPGCSTNRIVLIEALDEIVVRSRKSVKLPFVILSFPPVCEDSNWVLVWSTQAVFLENAPLPTPTLSFSLIVSAFPPLPFAPPIHIFTGLPPHSMDIRLLTDRWLCRGHVDGVGSLTRAAPAPACAVFTGYFSVAGMYSILRRQNHRPLGSLLHLLEMLELIVWLRLNT